MPKHHPKNERIKHRYFAWLEEAKRMSAASVDQAAAAISGFERSTGCKDFSAFHIEQARKFKRDLKQAKNEKTGKPIAKATIRSRLMAVRAFFQWLADQPGYKSRISYADCEYFNVSANDNRVATAKRERPVPIVDQIRHVLETTPHGTSIEKRDRALIAFALLTGMRDAAIASLPLGLINLAERQVFQDARLVETKNAKTMTTSFFPVGDDVEAIVSDWIAHLVDDLKFGPNDPLFPATDVGLNDRHEFSPIGLNRTFWSNDDAIRRIFKLRFEAAGLPYFHPHSLRKTLARLGEKVCRTPEEFKAWSQNLGHDQVLTTFTSYGRVDPRRQAEILSSVSLPDAHPNETGAPPQETIEWVLAHVLKEASN